MTLKGFLFAGLLTFSVWAEPRWIAHIPVAGRLQTHLVLVNRDSQPQSYRVKAFDSTGNPLGAGQGTLAPGRTYSVPNTTLFKRQPVAYIAVEAAPQLQAYAGYLAADGSMTRVPAQEPARSWQLFGNSPNTTHGFACINQGNAPTDIDLAYFRADGTLIEETRQATALEPNHKHLFATVPPEGKTQSGDYWRVNADQPILVTGLGFGNRPDQAPTSLTTLALPLSQKIAGTRDLTILFTNDEHGFMFADEHSDGAAGLAAMWREREGYRPDGPFLILSGGDMWTGPAQSNWSKGAAMTEVMSAMGYDAAALGNHELDFGLSALQERSEQAGFPILSANLVDAWGRRPPFAKPFTLKNVNGLNVGIVGLTTLETRQLAPPLLLQDLHFLDGAETLREVVPEVRRHGADLVVVIAHMCTQRMKPLADTFADLDIALIAGGHCNHLHHDIINGVPFVEAGAFMRHYARIDLAVDTETGEVITVDTELVANQSGLADPAIAALVAEKRREANRALFRTIGRNPTLLERDSPRLRNLIAEAWLNTHPEADAALLHLTDIGADLPAGILTPAHLLPILPGEHNLFTVEIDAAQLATLTGLHDAELHFKNSGDSLPAHGRYRLVAGSSQWLQRKSLAPIMAAANPSDINPREALAQWIEIIWGIP